MTKKRCGTLAVMLAVSLQICLAQESKETRLIFDRLNQAETSDYALKQILRTVEKGGFADRDYVAERLPGMIENPIRGKVWSNAVLLAGSLKVVNAIPSLIRVLPTTPFQSPVAMPFADDLTLKHDPVGEALKEIGDATVPELVKLLEQGDRKTRIRAARILWNIDSAASQSALSNDLNHETDPAIRRLSVGKSVPLPTPKK